VSDDQERVAYEQGLNGARIFFPISARRQLFIKRTGRLFVHYTSAAAALSILNTKSMWMRNVRLMNDFSEISHGIEQVENLIKSSQEIGALTNALNSISPGVVDRAVGRYRNWSNYLLMNTYLCCLSEHRPSEDVFGRLSMWRAYGGNSAKAALLFNFPFGRIFAAQRRQLIITPALYFTKEKLARYILEISENVSKSQEYLIRLGPSEVERLATVMLITMAISLKHPAFHEEREWRIVHIPGFYGNLTLPTDIEVINNIPQEIFKLRLEDIPPHSGEGLDVRSLIERIVIGPSTGADVLAQTFERQLARMGFLEANGQVVVSTIPLRTE
jgi:hypothetical protein